MSSPSLTDPRLVQRLGIADGAGNEVEENDSSLLGHKLKRRLMDIESSFIPDGGAPGGNLNAYNSSPGQSVSSPKSLAGAPDDTFLFGGSPGRTGNLAKTSPMVGNGSSSEPRDSSVLLPSSPAAAAMQRVLTKGSGWNGGLNLGVNMAKLPPDARGDEENIVPDPKRPDYLQHRQSSQRSSVSSIMARSDMSGGTENTIGAATVAGNNSNPSISRLPSLSSIASLNSSGQSERDVLARTRSSTSTTAGVLAAESALSKLEDGSSSQPATPRATSFGAIGTLAPSDTVIAQHVQNIRVPDTIAREYRAKHQAGTRSPERRLAIASSYSTRSRHNLTLKEQNNKIDKLSKENFDLKLKIHFLDQALQNRSDEGVKDMISKNVQLQTDLANEKKENQSLKRKIREMERKVKAQEDKPDRMNTDEEGVTELSEEKAELEEEITFLRETLQQMQTEITRLRDDNVSKEVEKRRLSDYVRVMGEQPRTSDSGSHQDVEGINAMWKDLLQQETARRELADDDAVRLKEEAKRLKTELHHINMTGAAAAANAARADADSRATTVVEHLKHENAELRRDLGAQTSMLTSRNRERERLQQEIEDLKLQTRRGLGVLDSGMLSGARSIAGDSIFDRSVSRAAQHNTHQRSASRASGITRVSAAAEMQSGMAGGSLASPEMAEEQEREELERTLDTLRDELARVKMLNQDLEKALNEHLDGLEALEQENTQLRNEGNLALEDLQALQSERDELLSSIEQKDADFSDLRAQAVEEIDKLQDELEQRDIDYEALRAECKTVSETAVRLQDELIASQRNEAVLQANIEDMEREITTLEQKTAELSTKNERLEVQLENSQNEVSFLREEQEGDKIKIGELDAALSTAESKIEDLLAQAKEERRQRDMLDSQEKADIQKLLDEINHENVTAKDEMRRLKAKLAEKQRESDAWKERLETLEADLKEALGDLTGTRSSILKDVTKLQRDLEHTLSALEISRQDLAEKERLLRTRDNLLESSGLETKKLSDLLDKERSARRADRAAWELMQRSQQSLTRTIQQSDTRVGEIETARQSERRKHANLEKKMREQLAERNTLLLTLWNNLSGLCGPEFASKHSIISPTATSSETLDKNFSNFSKDVSQALKAIESMFSGWKVQIRDMERNMHKEVQNIERALELRTKRVDHLEKTITGIVSSRASEAQQPHLQERQSSSRAGSSKSTKNDEYYSRLKSENKLLRQEVQILRNSAGGTVPERVSSQRSRERAERHYSTQFADEKGRPQTGMTIDPTDTVPLLPHPNSSHGSPLRGLSPSPTRLSAVNRRASHHAGVSYDPRNASPDVVHAGLVPSQPGSVHGSGSASEQRWVHRLKELERRLKAEREGRLLDRSGARKRIEESEVERERLRVQLEHELEMRSSLEDVELTGQPVADLE